MSSFLIYQLEQESKTPFWGQFTVNSSGCYFTQLFIPFTQRENLCSEMILILYARLYSDTQQTNN